jgi:hypothetical protein
MPEREQQQDSGNPRPSDRTHEIEARPRLLLKAMNGSSLGEAAGSARDTIKRGSVIFSKKMYMYCTDDVLVLIRMRRLNCWTE